MRHEMNKKDYSRITKVGALGCNFYTRRLVRKVQVSLTDTVDAVTAFLALL